MTAAVWRGPARWPLWLLAAPAAVSIWAGWVGLGQMCGYGVVHPLPGIADGLALNTAITLPIGMEAYSAYALGAWLSPRLLREAARRFAKRSALGALGLGLLGQGVYHLLETFGYQRAPWPVVLFVACLPVLVLGAGATLYHLLRTGGTGREHGDVSAPPSGADVGEGQGAPELEQPHPSTERAPAPASRGTARPARRRAKKQGGRRLRADFLAEAREKLAAEPAGTDPSPGWCRRATGCSERLSTDLAKTLRAEVRAARTGAGTSTGANVRTNTGTDTGTEAGASGRAEKIGVAA